jgi:Scramblase
MSISRGPLLSNRPSVHRRGLSQSGKALENRSTQPNSPQPPPSMSSVLANADPSQNNLLAPVHIAEDPNGIIKSRHPATKLLANSGLVVQRQIEMMNIFLGFEQANRYVILDPLGNQIGFMAEHDGGFGRAMGRQWFRTHRAFTTHVFDREQNEVLRVWACFAPRQGRR